jgi:hypothetical protein
LREKNRLSAVLSEEIAAARRPVNPGEQITGLV